MSKDWTIVGLGSELYTAHAKDDAVFLESHTATSEHYGAVRWVADLRKFQGKRIRLTAELLAENVESAGFWLRASTKGTQNLITDCMQDRLIKGSCDWTQHQLVIDVPVDATVITYGLWMPGVGKCAIRRAMVHIIDDNTVSPTHKIYEKTGPNKWTEVVSLPPSR